MESKKSFWLSWSIRATEMPLLHTGNAVRNTSRKNGHRSAKWIHMIGGSMQAVFAPQFATAILPAKNDWYSGTVSNQKAQW